MKARYAFLAIFVLFTFVFLPTIMKKKQKSKPTENMISDSILVEQEENVSLESEVYKVGFMKGQNAFMTQMNDPKAPPSDTKQEYTVSLDVPEEERKNLKEIMLKGYVDGYHKESSSLYCPRNDCPY